MCSSGTAGSDGKPVAHKESRVHPQSVLCIKTEDCYWRAAKETGCETTTGQHRSFAKTSDEKSRQAPRVLSELTRAVDSTTQANKQSARHHGANSIADDCDKPFEVPRCLQPKNE